MDQREIYSYVKKLAADAGQVVPERFNNKKTKVFGLLGSRTPATTYNYLIRLQKPIPGASGIKDDIHLVGCTGFNHPTAGVTFKNSAELGYRVAAELENQDNVVFTYWDTVDWIVTRWIESSIYQRQFSSTGLLMPDYATTICTVDFGPLHRVYNGCAISKPAPEGGSSNNGLLMFKFSLAYSSYDEKYNQVLL